MTVPIGGLPITGITAGSSSNTFTFSDNTTSHGLTLSNGSGISTLITADGNGNLRWGASVDGTTYKSHTFSKLILEEKIKEFQAGKYTRRYVEVYLEFMLLNAMLDNLEYLEYKTTLDKELI